MSTTRREFLQLAGFSFVSFGAVAPRLFAQVAQEAAAAGVNDNVLVVVELSGGNDGLNTLIPFENDLYYKNRPTLGIAKENILKLSDQVGFHPALEPLARLFKEGRLAVVQGAGYPEPDRSHFRSMEIWHTASTSQRVPTSGWLGSFLDVLPPPKDEAVIRGLALTGSLPQAFQADKTVVPVVGQLDAFTDAQQSQQPQAMLKRKLSTSGGGASNPVGFLRQQTTAVYRTADRLRDAAAGYQSTVEYPGSALGQQLRRAAQLLSGNLGVRVLFVSQDGYDTHAYQGDAHAGLLSDLATSLAAFEEDVRGLKIADRVAVMVFSEFGRRVDENASAGTDHGAASCMFVLGEPIKGGLYGAHPSLEKLGDGDLIFTTDFRQVYAGLLENFLGCPAKKVLGQEFAPLPLVRA
jgi:uncharacterized protein (DUF1501 family)